MKVKNNEFRLKDNAIQRNILFIIVFIIGYVLLVTAIAPKQYTLKEGDIPKSDIKAPRDTVDEKATKEKENQAIDKVGQQYTLRTEVKKNAEDNIKALFDKLSNLSNVDSSSDESKETYKISELSKLTEIQLNQSQCKVLVNIPKDNLADLEVKILKVIDKAYENRIDENDETTLKTAKTNASTQIDTLNLSTEISDTLKAIVQDQIKPNVFYDKEKTEEKIKEVQKSVSKVIIKQNQIIVKEGVPVTQEQLDILSDLGMLSDENTKINIYVYGIIAVFLAIILFLQYNYIRLNYKETFENTKKLILINVINLVALLLARAVGIISPFLIPFACAPMLLTLLLNYKISLVLSTLNLILICALNGFDIQVMIIGLVNSLLGATLLKKMQQRNELLYSTLYIAIVSAVLTLSTGILVSSNLIDVGIKAGITVVGGLLSGIFALGILPFLEGTFDEVTTLKLLELSNPNNQLLKKLLMAAPGTYHHSMLVANLAEVAAEEVGANPIVVRIGSYYHDIGKTERPYYFGENQMGGDNPHNNIPASLSSKIIISHVKDGLELARKHNLPKIIQDIIAEHHGTTIVKYFYYTVKNGCENPEEVNKEDYMYPGPIPKTKESGVVMLADSVEAAVRSIKDPNKDKINEMVKSIIDDKLASGQLSNCDLTLKDIEKIKKCFLTILNGIYHHRIEYPKENIKELSDKNQENDIKTKE